MPIRIPDNLVIQFPVVNSTGFKEIIGADDNYIQLFLNGVKIPIERIIFNGASPPSKGIISINRTLGTLNFHIGDKGKFLSGIFHFYARSN